MVLIELRNLNDCRNTEEIRVSRSGYSDDCDDQWRNICWRGAVKSAIKGKRGQHFLRELLDALDAMENKRLITDELETHGEFCTLGVIGQARGLDMSKIDPHESDQVSKAFNIADAMAREIVYENDEAQTWLRKESPETRWSRMRKWVAAQLAP